MKKQNGHKVKKLRWNRSFVVVASVLVLAIGLVGTTLAWITTNTESIINTFTPTEVTTTIVEELENDVKNNVTVKNTGDIDAYIRAMVVVTWQDDDRNVYPGTPAAGTDYQITIPSDNKWVLNGGYYYYTEKVAAGASTGVLLTKCKPLTDKEGYHLCVEILSDAIQAQPKEAVESAWPVTVNADGSLTVKTSDTGEE